MGQSAEGGAFGWMFVALANGVRWIYRPSRSDRIVDPVIQTLQYVRAWAGVAVVVWVTMELQSASTGELVGQRWRAGLKSVALLAVVCPLVVCAFSLVARRPNRGLYLRRAVAPLGAMLALGGTLLLLVSIAGPPVENWLLQLLRIPLALLLLVVLAYSVFLALTHSFRTADIHELVPPVLTTVVAWLALPFGSSLGLPDDSPELTQVVLLLGGPLSVSALAYFEIHRLRTHYGVTFRDALFG